MLDVRTKPVLIRALRLAGLLRSLAGSDRPIFTDQEREALREGITFLAELTGRPDLATGPEDSGAIPGQ